MSDNDADVILVTRDTQLQGLITRHRPPAAKLRCLTPADAKRSTALTAEQWWVDLDCSAGSEIGDCRRRVYFYSQPPEEPQALPTGLFLRKPCAVSVVTVLWAGVASVTDQPGMARDAGQLYARRLLPLWLLDLHELDLREFCHRCVQMLPARLGYAEIALYLFDAEQGVLTLAETNSKRHIDLAIPVAPENEHVLAAVARSGNSLITQDLAEACRTRGIRCPPDVERAPNRAAVIAPLNTRGQRQGLLKLSNRRGSGLSEVGLPLDHIFAFLARCLQHARRYQRARVEARVDRLTGLFNYRWMIEAVGKEIRRAQRYGNPLALIMIDLDGLKSVNDRFGHLAGDALLRHTAGKISAALRQIDSAARIGGDEFVVLLPATALDGARHVAQRIVTAIRRDAPLIAQKPLPVAASLGVAQWQEGWDENRLIQAADKAMYTAKCKGHNRLVCHPRKAVVRPAVAAPAEHAK
ncbi:MAG: diguanylate cyclase [Phycisphaerae bacterium]